MANLIIEQIVKEMRLENKNIKFFSPRVIAFFVRQKYNCSPYLAKKIAKQLTDDRK